MNKDIYIIGLNIYHGDSSACIMKNGEIIFAIEEERINRIKHWAGLPIESIKACLKFSNISIEKVDYIAINSNPFSNIFFKIKYSLMNVKDYKFFLEKLFLKNKKISFDKLLGSKLNVKKLPKIKYFDHHLCHMASAYFPSNFKKSLLISADGFGDFASTVAAVANNNSIDIKHKILFPHSLGIFYQAFTQLLGFKNYGDEYKVMGLSAYGKNRFKDKIDNVIKVTDGSFKLNMSYFDYNVGLTMTNKKFNDLFGGPPRASETEITQREMDLAASVQKVTEDIDQDVSISWSKIISELKHNPYLVLLHVLIHLCILQYHIFYQVVLHIFHMQGHINQMILSYIILVWDFLNLLLYIFLYHMV